MRNEPVNLEGTIPDIVPITPIRSETFLSKNPIHQLDRRGGNVISIIERNPNGNVTFQWDVSYNSKHGEPRALAYKLETVVINRRFDEERQKNGSVPEKLRLGSLTQISRTLDLGEDTNKVKKALLQNMGASISAKFTFKQKDGYERDMEINDTRFGVVFTGEKFPDGSTADCVYLLLHSWYRDVLNTVPTRPLDYDYLKALSPGTQRFYELLSFEIYAALKRHKGRAKMLYSDYCTHAPQKRYYQYKRMHRQMNDLHAPHLKSGYIADVEFKLIADSGGENDWEMLYTPGKKAEAEFIEFNTRGGSGQFELELPERAPRKTKRIETAKPTPEIIQHAPKQALTPQTETPPAVMVAVAPVATPTPVPVEPEPETIVIPPDPEQQALAAALVAHEVAPYRAQEFAREKPPTLLNRMMDAIGFKKKHGKTIHNPGGLLTDMIANPDKYSLPPTLQPAPQSNPPTPTGTRYANQQDVETAIRQRRQQIAARLAQLQRQMQTEQPQAFAEYLLFVDGERLRRSKSTEFQNRSPEIRAAMLSGVDSEAGRLRLFAEYFRRTPCPLPELAALLAEHDREAVERVIQQVS